VRAFIDREKRGSALGREKCKDGICAKIKPPTVRNRTSIQAESQEMRNVRRFILDAEANYLLWGARPKHDG
jgi:hypothetical protein